MAKPLGQRADPLRRTARKKLEIEWSKGTMYHSGNGIKNFRQCTTSTLRAHYTDGI